MLLKELVEEADFSFVPADKNATEDNKFYYVKLDEGGKEPQITFEGKFIEIKAGFRGKNFERSSQIFAGKGEKFASGAKRNEANFSETTKISLSSKSTMKPPICCEISPTASPVKITKPKPTIWFSGMKLKSNYSGMKRVVTKPEQPLRQTPLPLWVTGPSLLSREL
jgi:hypothetical protein